MPRVVIENMSGKSIDCLDKKEKLLDILLRETDWLHACGGKGNCTTCKVTVKDGYEWLPPLTKSELKYMNLQLLGQNERLACQLTVQKDLTIQVPDESKLPHLIYSN